MTNPKVSTDRLTHSKEIAPRAGVDGEHVEGLLAPGHGQEKSTPKVDRKSKELEFLGLNIHVPAFPQGSSK